MKPILSLALLLLVSAAHAVPVLVNYQGTYVNNAGVPVTQASAPVVVSIWDHATSTNTTNRKYQENHSVNISDGNFSLKIGSGSSPIGTFTASLFDTTSDLYLQLSINGEDMLPRVRFLSAPYTLQSENTARLGNQPATYYASAASVSALEQRLCKATYGAKWISSLNLCVGGSVDLTSINLSGQDLRNVVLYGATVTNTNFSTAQLNNATLRNLTISGTVPNFSSANLTDATLYNINLSGVSLSNSTLTRVMAAGITACPSALPTDWACVSGISSGSTPPYRLVGPTARFADDDFISPPTWLNTVFPWNLAGANFKYNVFRNCTFSQTPRTNLTNTTFAGATFSNCTYNDPIWSNTICPDGTNSNDNVGGGCLGHGM